MYEPEDIAALAMEFELSDPFDWGMLAIEEEDAYLMIADEVVRIINDSDTPELTAIVAMTKLLVENYVLNLQLLGIQNYEQTRP